MPQSSQSQSHKRLWSLRMKVDDHCAKLHRRIPLMEWSNQTITMVQIKSILLKLLRAVKRMRHMAWVCPSSPSISHSWTSAILWTCQRYAPFTDLSFIVLLGHKIRSKRASPKISLVCLILTLTMHTQMIYCVSPNFQEPRPKIFCNWALLHGPSWTGTLHPSHHCALQGDFYLHRLWEKQQLPNKGQNKSRQESLNYSCSRISVEFLSQEFWLLSWEQQELERPHSWIALVEERQVWSWPPSEWILVPYFNILKYEFTGLMKFGALSSAVISFNLSKLQPMPYLASMDVEHGL